ARPLPAETLPTERACNRVLAEEVVSPLDVPPFDRSAMDGFAVQAAGTEGAGDYNPLRFQVIGEALPGRPFEGTLQAGQAVRIMTGAPLPAGANAVVPAEYATEQGGHVELTTTVSEGKHVGRCGEDVRQGAVLLPAGRCLRPQDTGLLASTGIGEVQVVRQPRVRILITGNELATPGTSRTPWQIYESNSVMLAPLVERDGGVLESLRRLPDDRDAIRQALTEPGADVILVSGGSSVGREDHAPVLLAEEGTLAIHGVAMRPSSPAGLGRVGSSLVVLLPGNPVSCLCAFDFFAGRIIRLLGGKPAEWPYRSLPVPLRRKIVSAVGRLDYCRVRLTDDGAEPLALSGASILSSTSRADGFVIVPESLEGWPPGAEVTVHLYDLFPTVQPAAGGTR
ncbi:MAG: molybdopterin molybdotransferase MoeA, partial [Planctomycetaceae bacterium]|nr:molybdopterin molybdotransferase MoeA [Planctomycetaceae bacterium]